MFYVCLIYSNWTPLANALTRGLCLCVNRDLVSVVTRLPLFPENAMEQLNKLMALYSSEVARL